MFLHRLAAGLVFLAGVGLSRVGVGMESWPVLALGLLAATLGLWHFFMVGTVSQAAQRYGRRDDTPTPVAASRRDAEPARQPQPVLE